MKLFKSILISLIVFLCLPIVVNAKEDVNIYLFHASWCPHCKDEIKFLNSLEDEYDNINIYKYETSNNDNYDLMMKVKNRLGLTGAGIPFTVIGEKVLSGYSTDETTGSVIKELIAYYSENSHRDIAREIITNGDLKESIKDPRDLTDITNKTNEEKKGNTSNIVKGVPFFGDVDAKKISIPLLGVVLGVIDGFNPCAMWILLFLISMLIGMNNKKRMWAIGLTFLITSAVVYMLFMVAWLNVALALFKVRPVMIAIGLVALIGGFVNLRSYKNASKDDGCHVVKEEKRNKIFDRIRKFTKQKSFILALLGTMALAFSVNLVELACSAGIPVIYTQILAINELSWIEMAMYILIYIFFFLLDDLIVFAIAMKTLTVTGFTTKYSKYSHLIGGILMVIIGLLLLFRPDILMFNF